jgi:prepilin-type N-terminal cleavage/methylation domain-containing protein
MRHTSYKIGNTKYAFTLVEILIVVAIIGILAAIVLPTLQGHIQQAKEAAAKDNLRTLRNVIEVYAARHNDVPPGYFLNNPSNTPDADDFESQLVTSGHYLSKIPENPFNNKSDIKMIITGTNFPAAPVETGTYGWIYKPGTKKIRLNWPGKDSAGVAYFNY